MTDIPELGGFLFEFIAMLFVFIVIGAAASLYNWIATRRTRRLIENLRWDRRHGL